MSFIVSFGKYGGFYMHFGYSWRICLGWATFTIIPTDIDNILEKLPAP